MILNDRFLSASWWKKRWCGVDGGVPRHWVLPAVTTLTQNRAQVISHHRATLCLLFHGSVLEIGLAFRRNLPRPFGCLRNPVYFASKLREVASQTRDGVSLIGRAKSQQWSLDQVGPVHTCLPVTTIQKLQDGADAKAAPLS